MNERKLRKIVLKSVPFETERLKIRPIKDGDFHGATYFERFESIDKSNEFIDLVSDEFVNLDAIDSTLNTLEEGWNGMSIVQDICQLMQVEDYKKVKPGIGETTRVLLRRVPWKVLINKDISDEDPDIQHILVLCREKKIPTMRWDLGNYKVCGIIKELSADAQIWGKEMNIDFDNITMQDIKDITDDEIKLLKGEQLMKYALALKKYAFLMGTFSETTKAKDFIKSLEDFKDQINDDTTLCVVLKDEYRPEVRPGFLNSEHCFVAYIDTDTNKLIVQNFV